MAKEFDDEWEDDFIDIDISANRTGKKDNAPQEAESESAARPVKKMEKVLDDPLAESESTEDIYSGRYKRDTSDRGVYTGGTRKDRMMDSTDTAEDRAKRMERRRRDRRRKTLILIILAVIVIGAVAFAVYRSGILSTGGAAETSSEAETSSAATEESTEEALSVDWEKDGNTKITELVTDYYAALADADADTLETLVDESVEINADSLTSQAEFIEGYEDISTYVTDGENEGEYAVFIVYSTKFVDIETAAPGMSPAYVKTDSEGALRLLTYQYFDDAVTEYMTALSNTEEILTLSEEVQAAYEQAQEGDEDLKAFIAALSSTGEETEETTGDEETSGEETSAEETTAEETTKEASESGEITFEEVDNIQYAIDNVKCRTTPSTEGDDYELVMLGDWVHVIGESDEWCKVVLSSGTVGYIYSEYLSPYQPETTEAEEEEAE